MIFVVSLLCLSRAEQDVYTSSLAVTEISTDLLSEGEDLLVTLEREETVPVVLLACPTEIIFEEDGDSSWDVLTTLYNLEPWANPLPPKATIRINSSLISPGQKWNIGVYSPSQKSFHYAIKSKPQPANMCSSPCNYNGFCNQGKCECFLGYKGKNCEIRVDSLVYSHNYTMNYKPYQWSFYQIILSDVTKYILVNSERYQGIPQFFLNFQTEELPSMLGSSAELYFEDNLKFSHSFEHNGANAWLLGVYCKGPDPCQMALNLDNIEKPEDDSVWLVILLVTAGVLVCLLIPLVIKMIAKLRAASRVQESVAQVSSCKMQKMFPRIRWEKISKDYDSTCSICLDNFTDEDYVRVLGCGHVYHEKCIDIWVADKAVCPLCKESVINQKVREVVSHQEDENQREHQRQDEREDDREDDREVNREDEREDSREDEREDNWEDEREDNREDNRENDRENDRGDDRGNEREDERENE